MKKLALLLMLALATSAFGAVSLTPTPNPVTAGLTAGTTFSVDLMLKTDGEAVTGFSLFPFASLPGAIQLTGRTIGTTGLSEVIKADSALGLPLTLGTAIDMSKDLGTSTPLGDAIPAVTQPTRYETLTFALLAPVPSGTTINFGSVGWADPDFGFNEISIAPIVLTPEPASMLLLAAGAAFFARRRRA